MAGRKMKLRYSEETSFSPKQYIGWIRFGNRRHNTSNMHYILIKIAIFGIHFESLIFFYVIFTSKDKGQLILKCLFGFFNFFQKANKKKSTWGIIVVKLNLFVRFLEETSAWKYYFDFVWPLLKDKIDF